MAFVQQSMPSAAAHDELAALFSRNLTFSQHDVQSVPRNMVVPSEPSLASPAFSASQHYHHSTHVSHPQVAEQQQQQTRSASDSMTAEAALRIHGVNPDSLTPSQLHLFRVADHAQKRRLLELWSIFPPNSGGEIPSLAWSSTSLEQEEQIAHIRYERNQQRQQQQQQQQQEEEEQLRRQQLQQQQQQQQQQMAIQNTAKSSQGIDGQWHTQPAESEPYMYSGYEELMRREREKELAAKQRQQQAYSQATDPVYMGPDFARQQQQVDMATQYGAFQHLRGGQPDTMDVMM
ncbi:hypothetical protein GMORB2_5651 [Geosmithia morbida]|uniref:Uncharacterized protein n=1 Tax=Geosmithia morbida TaxID=1094350 RepID=A0A9P5D5M3_9HYPO|nr:uncharacterized protein GMORB2_5651 [Geosmithia morbida]KAF4123935.1 hypothetical protein GMORB2_5651 [Geosmithia morbida]